MTENTSFERLVAEHLSDDGSGAAQAERIAARIYDQTGDIRQRARWIALIKEPPMRISSSLAVGSPVARIAALLVATLLLALTVAGAGVAGSRLFAADGTIVVDPSGGGTTTTITEAVARAADGDTILVRPGLYDEQLVITSDITIRGDGDRADVVISPSEAIPFGAQGQAPGLPHAFVLDGSNAIIENLTLRGEAARILITGGSPTLQRLHLDGAGRVFGVDPGSSSVPGALDILEGSTATFADNKVSDGMMSIETGSSPRILRNTIEVGGIWMQGAGVDPVIEGNIIDSQQPWGIAIWGGAQPEVLSNIITAVETGVEIDDAGFDIPDTGTDPLVRGNTISGAKTGVWVFEGTSATIDDNEISSNEIGVSLAGSDAALTRNTICGNGRNLVLNGTAEMPDETNQICEDAPEPSE